MPFSEGTPSVSVTLAGKLWQLGYTLGAMKRAKDLGVLDVDMTDNTAFILALPEFVWACLDESGRTELSVEAIRELLNPLNAKEITRAMVDLFEASLPKRDPDPNADPAAVKEPTAGLQTSSSSGQLEYSISG